MSNPIRYDPPLVRALAAELHERLSGRAAVAAPVFAKDLSATLPLDRGEALRFDLHPSAGWVRIVPRSEGSAGVPADARIAGVTAPPDERLLRIELREGNRFRGGARTLVVELHTNQWNALLVDRETGRIVSVLRAREAGDRPLKAGARYEPPAGEPRFGARRVTEEEAWVEWSRVLAPVPPGERVRALVRGFADASPLNAAALLGDAARVDPGDGAALRAAFERWWAVHATKRARPVLLSLRGGAQPYPFPLEGVPSRPVPSLLAGMEAAEEERSRQEPAAASDGAELLRRARRRLAAAEGRVGALETEYERTAGAEEVRHRGDLILAYLHLVPVGASSARLPEFDGGVEVEVPLDPTLRPKDNAQRCYDEAARLERARERIPALLEAARREVEAWAGAVAELEGGEPSERTLRLLERDAARARRKAGGGAKKAAAGEGERKPYRLYRSSGGLEIRVGRTSKDNDRLTFAHAAPEDVWLHAREVPGSHVVLRWSDPAAAPPARDLAEAAALAAWHSKARTSGTVAVSWTRRKHVRKPRGAPPGRVSVLHAKTVFAAPDAAEEERLRVTEADGPAE